MQTKIKNKDEACTAINAHIAAHTQLEKLKKELSDRKKSLTNSYEERIANLEQSLASTAIELKNYVESNREELFGKSKSLIWVKGCTIGFRKMPVTLDIKTDDEVHLKAILSDIDTCFLTEKTTVNFDKSYILKKISTDEKLRQHLFELGISTKEEERLYITVE
jgi:phage host-nuclease inhibitor protein Gam